MTLTVQGAQRLTNYLTKQIPEAVLKTVAEQMEKEAEKLVQMMRQDVPQEGITVEWTWGDAPAGSITIGTFRGREYGRLVITVYAMGDTKTGRGIGGKTGPFPALARWAEFGTAERFHKSGKYTGRIKTGPFFYSNYRERRDSIKRNVSRAVTRGIKKR